MFYNVLHFFFLISFLQQIYDFTFANSANNTAIISAFNVSNCDVAKVYRSHDTHYIHLVETLTLLLENTDSDKYHTFLICLYY